VPGRDAHLLAAPVVLPDGLDGLVAGRFPRDIVVAVQVPVAHERITEPILIPFPKQSAIFTNFFLVKHEKCFYMYG